VRAQPAIEAASPQAIFAALEIDAAAVPLDDASSHCRQIATDIGAAHYALFFTGKATGSSEPFCALGSGHAGLATHDAAFLQAFGRSPLAGPHAATAPCWWQDDAERPSTAALARLAWANQCAPLVPGTTGIAFPVHAPGGERGAVLFVGRDIVVTLQGLLDAHAACFSLFASVERARATAPAASRAISRRELQCLKLAANGYTSEEISRLLDLSVHTANQYLTNTAEKLDAVNRTHAIAKALRLGLIE
jgi:DNA-binding CsgD family transcriptional regulator